MSPLKINLVKLGNLKFPVSFPYLENWRSDLMQISHSSEIGVMPNAKGENWTYLDSQLKNLINHDQSADITIAIINAPLENNFYLRRINGHTGVLSLYETADILSFNNLMLEQFIIRNLYEISLAYLEHGNKIPSKVYEIAHDETRSCLFDMCADKTDIIFSTGQPIICDSCRARLLSKQLDKDLIPTLEKELKRIRKALFYRIIDFVKKHPIISLILTAVSGLLLNLLGNILYNINMKELFEQIKQIGNFKL